MYMRNVYELETFPVARHGDALATGARDRLVRSLGAPHVTGPLAEAGQPARPPLPPMAGRWAAGALGAAAGVLVLLASPMANASVEAARLVEQPGSYLVSPRQAPVHIGALVPDAVASPGSGFSSGADAVAMSARQGSPVG